MSRSQLQNQIKTKRKINQVELVMGIYCWQMAYICCHFLFILSSCQIEEIVKLTIKTVWCKI